MADVNNERLHAVIEGRVQGVGFRYFVLERAQELNLTGWVRNTFEGNVEVTAEGPRTDLEALLMKLRTGPRAAYVTDVTFEWGSAAGEFKNFNVRSTL
jgi:acylphosphatase